MRGGKARQPLAWAAHWHSLNIGQGWSEDRAADTAAVFDLAGRALALEPGNALAQATFGHNSAYLRRDPDTALQPDFAVGSCSEYRMPLRGAAARERFARDLRAAGLPA